MAICNVPESSIVRESDLVLMTRAGPEIGVASTKAFTTQLVALAMFALELARVKGLDDGASSTSCASSNNCRGLVADVLKLDPQIRALADRFVGKQHALFLGRGTHWPVAMEGALKLKEISYIHAEAYAAGELKHGPLALVDADMPVIAIAPNDQLVDKLMSNLEEVRARGGELYVFVDTASRSRGASPNVGRTPWCRSNGRQSDRAGGVHGPAAAAVVSRRRAARHRRRSAAQSGEERHGRVIFRAC